MALTETRVTESRRLVCNAMESIDVSRPEESLGELYGSLSPLVDTTGTALMNGNGTEDITSRKLLEASVEFACKVHQHAGLANDVESVTAFALGVYTEEEGSYDDQNGKGDIWRDEPLYDPSANTDIYRHTKHELQEIQRNINNQNLDYLIHNAADLVGLAAILRAAVLERRGCRE